LRTNRSRLRSMLEDDVPGVVPVRREDCRYKKILPDVNLALNESCLDGTMAVLNDIAGRKSYR